MLSGCLLRLLSTRRLFEISESLIKLAKVGAILDHIVSQHVKAPVEIIHALAQFN